MTNKLTFTIIRVVLHCACTAVLQTGLVDGPVARVLRLAVVDDSDDDAGEDDGSGVAFEAYRGFRAGLRQQLLVRDTKAADGEVHNEDATRSNDTPKRSRQRDAL